MADPPPEKPRRRKPAGPGEQPAARRPRTGTKKPGESKARKKRRDDAAAAAMLGLDAGPPSPAGQGEETGLPHADGPIVDEQTPGGLRAVSPPGGPTTATPPGEPDVAKKPRRKRPRPAKPETLQQLFEEGLREEEAAAAEKAASSSAKRPGSKSGSAAGPTASAKSSVPDGAPEPSAKPKRPVVERGRRVPVAGLITVLIVVAASLFQYWNYNRQAAPTALLSARYDLRRAQERVMSLEQSLSNNVNPDSRAKKLGALNEAEAELERFRSVEREARAEFEFGLDALAARWRDGSLLHWVEEYFVIVGAAVLPGSGRVGELTATFGYFADATDQDAVTGIVFVGVTSSLGWATAGLLLALMVRWLVRASLWRACGGPPFGAWDRALGVESPWFACALRMTPFVPSWPLDLVVGVTPFGKRAMFFGMFVGSLVPSMLSAFVGLDAGSLLAVRIGDAAPATSALIYSSVAGVGLLAIRLAVSPSVRGGVTRLNEIADDADAPTVEDALRDMSVLDEDGGGRQTHRGGDRRRGR
ncbi:MAG: hypothetical protein AAF532_09020 [Planctomycetota bacterium]